MRAMRPEAPRRPRTGAAMLPVILLLAFLLVGLGLSGSFQVSHTRRVLERLHAARLVELASASACEEVSARVEALVPRIPTPEPGKPRDLARSMRASFTVEPELTRRSLADQAVEVSAVRVESSPWRLSVTPVRPGEYRALEIGILQLTVRIRVRTTAGVVDRTVVTRRLAEAVPPPGSSEARVKVQFANALRRIQGS
jgi:hypothetical protein